MKHPACKRGICKAWAFKNVLAKDPYILKEILLHTNTNDARNSGESKSLPMRMHLKHIICS